MDLSVLQKAVNFKNNEKVEGQVVSIDIEKIKPDPNQPRKEFDEEKLQELASDIKLHGLIQPILVRRNEDDYFIITGERRFRAVKLNNEKQIKAIIQEEDIKNDSLGYIQVSENIKRDDLKFYELAEFIINKVKEGVSQKDVAEKLGISKSRINLYMSWQDAPDLLKDNKHKFNAIRAFNDLANLFSDDTKELMEEYINSVEKISNKEVNEFKKQLNKENQTEENNPIPSFTDNSRDTDSTEELDTSMEEEQPIKSNDMDMFSEQKELEQNNDNEESAFERDIDTSTSSNTEDFNSDNFETTEVPGEDNDNIEDNFQNQETEAFDNLGFDDQKKDTFKKPVIYGSVDGREAELLYKKKPSADGMICIKYEDGFEEEILAEEFKINRICE